ncbi:MAG: hypothetical protein U1E39_01360 [Planctomycetota bacterium]
MTLDPKDDSVAETPKGNPFDGVAASFLDVLVLFLRTIPLYPDGHGRVVAVTEKFQAALAERGTATVVEPTEGGLRVDGEDHPSLSNGAQAFRDALVRTAVSRVTFQADAPHASYVVFARSLQRNARLAQSGHLTFTDLWMAPLEGIAVEEQTFSREDFTGEPTDGNTVIGGRRDEGGEGGSGSGGGTGDGVGAGDGRGTGRGGAGRGAARGVASLPGTVAAPAVGVGAVPTPAVKAPPRRGRTLRALILDDADAAALLGRVREKLAARGEFDDGTDGPRQDVLDHLLASLPIEARLDLGRGVTLVRDVLRRLDASLDGAGGRNAPEMSSALLRAMENVFPDRVGELRAMPLPAVPAPTAVAAVVDPDEAQAAETSAVDDVAWATAGQLAHLPPAAFDAVDGISDEAGVLTHALLEVPVGPRLDVLRGRLAAALHDRPPLARPPCIVDHLRAVLAEPPEKRDGVRVRALAGALEQARIDVANLLGAGLDPDLVVAAFPALAAPFVAAGGSVGYLARALGRSAVVAAGPELVAPDALLAREDLVQRVLDERTRDALPFIELMLPAKDPSRRRAILASLRRTDLPSVAAVALRVASEAALSDDFLRVLCDDGFSGRDSHRGDEEAVKAIGAVAQGETAGADAVARAYATSTLAAFNPALAGPVVRALARRTMLVFGAPKEVRGAAALVLEKWERGEGRDGFGLVRAEEDRP